MLNGHLYTLRLRKLIYLYFVYRLFREAFTSLVRTLSPVLSLRINLSAFIYRNCFTRNVPKASTLATWLSTLSFVRFLNIFELRGAYAYAWGQALVVGTTVGRKLCIQDCIISAHQMSLSHKTHTHTTKKKMQTIPSQCKQSISLQAWQVNSNDTKLLIAYQTKMKNTLLFCVNKLNPQCDNQVPLCACRCHHAAAV